jgi:hypothetical protein
MLSLERQNPLLHCTATATFLLFPEWLGWSKNGYMRVSNYPRHACVLANFYAKNMLLNPHRSLIRLSTLLSAQQE